MGNAGPKLRNPSRCWAPFDLSNNPQRRGPAPFRETIRAGTLGAMTRDPSKLRRVHHLIAQTPDVDSLMAFLGRPLVDSGGGAS